MLRAYKARRSHVLKGDHAHDSHTHREVTPAAGDCVPVSTDTVLAVLNRLGIVNITLRLPCQQSLPLPPELYSVRCQANRTNPTWKTRNALKMFRKPADPAVVLNIHLFLSKI